MASTKTHYNRGLKALKQAQKLLQEAEKEFAVAGYSIDDFPTARNETLDISKRVEDLKDQAELIHTCADVMKIR